MSAHPSIRRRLLAMLISTIVIAWLVILLLVYRAAGHEVEEVFDADLARSARTLQTLLLHEVEEEREMTAKVREVVEELGSEGLERYPRLASTLREYGAEEVKERLELVGSAQQAGHRYGGGLIFIARYADGSEMLRDHSAPDIPLTHEGYSDIRVGDQDWRIFRLTDAGSGFVVQVGERRVFRAELVSYITRNTLTPLLVALPLLALLIWVVVGHALGPLRRVASEVSTRAADALEPIDDSDTPQEIQGLLSALNKLFVRVQAALDRERQFTADAAHELRTPLAAMKTHLQVALKQVSGQAPRHSLQRALDGVDRATHSVEQLLVLARADAEQTRVLLDAEVDLRDIAVDVVSVMSQQAFERDIDLGIDEASVVAVRGDATALHLLLRNLVDNAVRYTPRGGTVTVSVREDGAGPCIEVADDGVGISPAQRKKIFNRFHRGPEEQTAGTSGSGLGLSIVRRIADLHGASVTLDDGLQGRGLAVRVCFPRGY